MAATTWFGFAAPAGLPAAITQQMNNAIGAALDNPKFGGRLVSSGFELERMSPPSWRPSSRTIWRNGRASAKRLIPPDGGK